MSHADGQLLQGNAIRRFLFSERKRTRFAEFYTGERAEKGAESEFCRRVFCRTMAQRRVDPQEALPCQSLAHADAQGQVTFTDYACLPFHLQRWLRVELMARQAGIYPFQLATCGGVRLWRDQQTVAQFLPFSRNAMQSVQVAIPLQAGKNSLLIHLDELAERETFWGVKMVYLGRPSLSVGLPAGQINAEYHSQAARLQAPPRNDCASQLLSLMRRREYGAQADALLAGALKHVSAREAGSVFSLLPLLLLWREHQGEYFPPPLWRRVKSTLLGYRYGADERGCDAMCFDDEQHARAFCRAQSLAGQTFPDALFIASGRRGREQQAIARRRQEQNGWLAEVQHDAK